MIPEVARPSRRRVVAVAALAVGAAGCSKRDGGDDGRPRSTAAEPGVAEQAAAARDSAALAGQYDGVIAAYPSLAARLAPLRAEVARHVTAFGGVPPTASAAAASTAAPTAPPTPAGALAALAGAERTLADRRAKVLLDVPGELARLMASVAAAGAGHAALLGGAG
ncbi:hypothetical protein [Streptomyces sp. CA-111067]|uniref:hypothetical protein n=1 Tax=Streptomyces sp. CA-111067 TaxID=3240046 RepID=UPI003D99D5EE